MMLGKRGAFSNLKVAAFRLRAQASQLLLPNVQNLENSSSVYGGYDGVSIHRFASTESLLVPAPTVPIAWRKFPPGGQVFQEVVEVGKVKVCFETGKLARFAAGAVVVGVAETKVLVTVVADHKLDPSRNFLPLQVEYREKQYAQGKIPATFMRREGAPKERELLCGRLIDRSVRPLFPRGFFYDSQIIANVLCSDGEQDPDVLAVNAASAALMISDVPWKGPIGCVRIGRVAGKFVVNPNMDELGLSDLNLVYACTAEKTVMIETQACEISNQDYIAALHLAHGEASKLIPAQLELAAKVAAKKRPLPVITVPVEVLDKVRSLAQFAIESVMGNPEFGKFERGQTLSKIEEEVRTLLADEGDEEAMMVLPNAFDAVKKEVLRKNIFEKGVRVDGRGLNQVRELQCEAGTYPALHGSSLFSRGNTQVLCTVTMGAPEDAQRLDSLVGVDRKRFMVHYGFPPFSINETGRTGGLNRREVGHGTLAEKALVALLPPEEDFPYSLRVTSECLASDGSSSMATVCGGSIALMDAGIQLRAHVGAVSVGLVSLTDPETGLVTDYRILTDILGLEDHLGDMDFKIAGTRKGITAIQLDIKPAGVPLHILCEALEHALVGRCHILDFMEKIIRSPRDASRENLPRNGTMNIQLDSIGRLIGPQGSNVKNIQRLTDARLSITGDGVVTIFARDQASFDMAKSMVEASVGKEVEVGGTYIARVLAIKDFGAFMELNGGYQGLLHISEIAHERIERVSDHLAIGQELSVVCIGRDLRGNLKLSRKMTLPAPLPQVVPPAAVSEAAGPEAKPKQDRTRS